MICLLLRYLPKMIIDGLNIRQCVLGTLSSNYPSRMHMVNQLVVIIPAEVSLPPSGLVVFKRVLFDIMDWNLRIKGVIFLPHFLQTDPDEKCNFPF